MMIGLVKLGLAAGLVALATNAEAQTVTGSGTAGTVPVFTGSGTTSTIGNSNSPVFVDPTSGNVGIGTTTPLATLDIKGGLFVRGYVTPNTGSSPSYAGQWTQLGDCSITVQYSGCNALIQVIGGAADGATNGDISATINWRVKQHNALGGAPYVQVDVGNLTGADIQPSQFMAITTTMTTSLTDVQLWVQIADANEAYNFTPTIVESSTSGVLKFLNSTGFTVTASLPAGAQVVGNIVPNVGGSATAPSITFNGDPGTGIFQPAAGSIGISTGGTEQMALDSSGNVSVAGKLTVGSITPLTSGLVNVVTTGDGTTSQVSSLYLNNTGPDYPVTFTAKVDQNYGANATAGISTKNLTLTGGSSGSDMVFGPSTAAPTALVLKANGNVGIGTTSAPLSLLSVGSSSQFQVNSSGAVTASSFSGSGSLLTGISAGQISGVALNANPSFTGSMQVNGNLRVSDNGLGTAYGQVTLYGGAADYPALSIEGRQGSSPPSDGILRFDAYGAGYTGYIKQKSDATGLQFIENGNLAMTMTGTGNVGIGTTSPSFNLDVNGKTRVESNDFNGVTFEKQANPNQGSLLFSSDRTGYTFVLGNKRSSDGNVLPIISMYDLGNVGIGTTNPGVTLDVLSQSGADAAIRVNAPAGRAADFMLNTTSGSGYGALKLLADSNEKWRIGFVGQTSDVQIGTMTSGWQERVRIASTGNVGIGTTNPQALLDIQPGADGATSLLLSQQNCTTCGWSMSAKNDGVFRLFRSDNPSAILSMLYNNGYVGIGTTTTPAYKLDVAGQIRSSSGGIVFPDGSTQTTAYTQVASGTNTITQSNGNVGIGTTNPAAKLEVTGYKNYYIDFPIAPDTGNFGDPSSFYLLLHPAYSSGNPMADHYVIGTITAVRGGTGAWNRKVSCSVNTASAYNTNRGTATCSMENWPLVTVTYQGTSYIALQPPVASVLYNLEFTGYYLVQSGDTGLTLVSSSAVSNITPFVGDTVSTNGNLYVSGNVGIGTTNPSAKLEISGTAQVDGQLTVGSGGIVFPNNGGTQTVAYTGVTCGGDYAESVDVSGDRTRYEPGDVLVIDSEVSGKFLKSAEPYSTSVTGIYSTKPGTVGRRQLGPKNADEVPMAMIGIVPTKVTAENGPIRRGDLLVSSSKIGYAMRGTDRGRMLGAVIGKALDNLDSGEGVIEVVVTLQ